MLPVLPPLTQSDEKAVRDIFMVTVTRQESCPERVDIDVSLTFSRVLASGSVTGYLQALAPSYLRFEGVNPLGLTELLFSMDGEEFTFLNVRDQKAHLGSVEAETVQRYLPGGVDFSDVYSWLVGRVSHENFAIKAIERSQNSGEYWLTITSGRDSRINKVLFSQTNGRIIERLLIDEQGNTLVRFVYEYDILESDRTTPNPIGANECSFPERLIIDGNGKGTLTLNFNKNYPDSVLSPVDFIIKIPSGYLKEIVK